MLNKIILSFMISIITLSCSSIPVSFTVDTEVDNVSDIPEPKKVGIIVRTSAKSKVSRTEVLKNLSNWLNGFKHNTRLDLISDLNQGITEYTSDEERFFQVSDTGEFLKYKSIGILKSFIRSNKNKLGEVVSGSKYDAILVYEIHGIYSSEMQLMIYNSVITMLDKKFEPLYLDHQRDYQELAQYSPNAISKEMMDRISMRFLKKMERFGYIEEL